MALLRSSRGGGGRPGSAPSGSGWRGTRTAGGSGGGESDSREPECRNAESTRGDGCEWVERERTKPGLVVSVGGTRHV